MKLGDFLQQQGGARPGAMRAVTFRVVGTGAVGEAVTAEARAELTWVSEADRQAAWRDAETSLRELYGTSEAPDDRREDERAYHLLYRALRDADDPRQPFADSVRQLRQSLVRSETVRICDAYGMFMEEEFPDPGGLDAEAFGRLVDEAKKASLGDLISSFGYDAVRRSMPGLLAHLKTSRPPT